MQEVFMTRYAMYCVFITFSQCFLISIVFQYSATSLLYEMRECKLYIKDDIVPQDILKEPAFVMTA
jgi:hypothetical protein